MNCVYTQEDFVNSIDRLSKLKLWGFKEFETGHFLYRTVLDYMLLNTRVSFSIKGFLSRLITSQKKYTFSSDTDNKTVLYWSQKYDSRKDMNEILGRVSNVSDYVEVLKESYERIRDPFILFHLHCVIQWYVAFKRAKFPKDLILAFLYDTLWLFRFLHFLQINRDQLLKARAFIVLNDEYCDENLFVQFGKNNKIPTATLQHGAYSKGVSDNNLSHFQHVYYNLTADRCFVWGDYYKDVGSGWVSPSVKLLPLGIPKYIDAVIPEKYGETGIFGVFLDAPVPWLWDSNMQLIRMANELAARYDYTYIVKLHPSDQQENYTGCFDKQYCVNTVEIEETVLDFCRKSDFAIVGASSTYIEMLYFGVPVFRYYNGKYMDVFSGLDYDKVTSFSDLVRKYEIFRNKPDQYAAEVRKEREYCCGKGNVGENYRRAILELMERKDLTLQKTADNAGYST